jgi:hypothetical protein
LLNYQEIITLDLRYGIGFGDIEMMTSGDDDDRRLEKLDEIIIITYHLPLTILSLRNAKDI